MEDDCATQERLLCVEFWACGAVPFLSHNGVMTAAEALAMAQGRRVVLTGIAEAGARKSGFGDADKES